MTCARKILLSLALVILGLGFSSPASAYDMYSNTVAPDNAGTHVYASGTTTVSGTIEFVDVSIGQFTGSNPSWSYELYERNNVTGVYGSCNSIDSLSASERNVPLLTSNSNGSETRVVTFQMAGAGCTKAVGQKASFYLYVNSNLVGKLGRFGGTGTIDETGNQYLVLRTTPNATSSRIVQINEPLSGSISTSTDVLFDFSYFNNDTDPTPVEYAGVELLNTTNQTSVFRIDQPIITSGGGSYRRSIPLIANNQYIWRPYLRTATTSSFIYGDAQIFNVVTNPAPSSLYTQPLATSTATSTEGKYLNIISLLQNKHPIAYIPQTYALLQEEATLEGDSTFPKLTFDFTDTRLGSTTLGLTEVDMFSTTTITHFFNEDQINLFKTLITAVIWVGVVTFLVNDIRRTLLSTKN